LVRKRKKAKRLAEQQRIAEASRVEQIAEEDRVFKEIFGEDLETV